MRTNWQELFEKPMKLPSESLVLAIISLVAVAVICFSGLAMEYGWLGGTLQEASVVVSHGVSSTERVVPTNLNINTATVSQLASLPGMDEALATKVVVYCFENGPILESSQLLAVEGMDEETLILILPFITFE